MTLRLRALVGSAAILVGWGLASAAFFRTGPSVGEAIGFVCATLAPAALVLWAALAVQEQRRRRRAAEREHARHHSS